MENNRMILKAIAAVNLRGYIGKDGKLMWKCKEDFKHFKKMTMGGILIVGRKTFENDFGGVGLPGRECVVIGKAFYNPLNALIEAHKRRSKVIHLMDERNELIARGINIENFPEVQIPDIWVVGGGEIYKLFMPFIDEFHLSCINDTQIGDTKLEIAGLRGTLISYNFEPNINESTKS